MERLCKPLKLAFISRHQPDGEQIRLAAEQGYELIPIGDRDAFTMDTQSIEDNYAGAVVVHPAAALRLIARSGVGFVVGVFENSNRAPEGEKPQFAAKRLHLFDMDIESDCDGICCSWFSVRQNGVDVRKAERIKKLYHA